MDLMNFLTHISGVFWIKIPSYIFLVLCCFVGFEQKRESSQFYKSLIAKVDVDNESVTSDLATLIIKKKLILQPWKLVAVSCMHAATYYTLTP